MRGRSLIVDIFILLRKAPWWISVSVAALFWIVGQFVTAGMYKNAMQNVMRPYIFFLFNSIAVVALVAAVVSVIRGLFRRKLLDRQNGIDTIRSLPWREFEQLVGEAFRRQGYDIEETGGGGADGGVDLILRGHNETVLVQCKQWRVQQVGVDKVRELFGVVTAEGANHGILVTSGKFTDAAQTFKVGKPLTLLDGPALAQLVLAVQPVRSVSTPPSLPVPANSTTGPRYEPRQRQRSE